MSRQGHFGSIISGIGALPDLLWFGSQGRARSTEPGLTAQRDGRAQGENHVGVELAFTFKHLDGRFRETLEKKLNRLYAGTYKLSKKLFARKQQI